MKKIFFSKLNGAGNDFILLDERLNGKMEINPEIISKLCQRRTSIGADGILLISDIDGYDFELKYFNADGYEGSLCGNGSRCAIHYANTTNRVKNNKTKFICKDTEYSGEIISTELIQFNLNEPKEIKLNFNLEIENKKIVGNFIDNGSPHLVINYEDLKKMRSEIDNFDQFSVVELGKKFRYADYFKPSGTNVNFIKLEDNKVLIRTYERGVEDETYACGTGSVASAMISFLNSNSKPPIKVCTKNKNELIVDFKYINNEFADISLTGPAKIDFEGHIII
ncbi:MAG: diaminopimelate epimerase [Ignavibacteriales bacterium]|nr:diaminopimelate epimerase [Ignavibacteriales bacterium]